MIYLDNCATTKVLDNISSIVDIYYTEKYFNPSALYEGAISVNKEIVQARKTLSNCLGCNQDELIFTSGGSESDNTAIFGAVKNKKGRIITTLGEHLAIYTPFNELKNRGFDVQYAKLNQFGQIDFEHFKSLVNSETVFVSVIHASNETGAVNDINKIFSYAKSINTKCIVHSDGVQAFLKQNSNVADLNVDLYSISGHKVHCPKGIGALYIKKGIKINPVIYGASQEFGIRAGTENTPLICAFAKTSQILSQNIKERTEHYQKLKNRFLDIVENQLEDYVVNGNHNTSLANIISLSIAKIKSEILILMLSDKQIYIGSGSACSSKQKISRVLKEAAVPQRFLEGSVRISFSHFNTIEEIDIAASELCKSVKTLRKMIS